MKKLHEGLIKLPQALLAEMQDFILTWYFAYVQVAIDRRFRFDEESGERAQRFLDAAKREYGIVVSRAHVVTARTKLAFMRSFLLQENIYGEELNLKVKLKLVLERHAPLGSNIGVYRDRTAFITLSPYNMHMTGASLSTLSSLRASLQKVPGLIGFLEHELTHLVQDRALALKHDDQVKGVYSHSSAFTDNYGLAPVEFDPLIKSSLRELERYEARYKSVPGYSRSELIGAFVHAIKPPPWMRPEDISQFFGVLKRRAPVRWKRAVKLFTDAY